MPSNWDGLVYCISEDIFTKWFSVCNTWLTQYHPQTHTLHLQKYLDRRTLDDPIPNKPTGELHGRPEGVPITETQERKFSVFEAAKLDVVETYLDHVVEGTTAPSASPTN